jgi:hypothetical protein
MRVLGAILFAFGILMIAAGSGSNPVPMPGDTPATIAQQKLFGVAFSVGLSAVGAWMFKAWTPKSPPEPVGDSIFLNDDDDRAER